MKTGRRWASTKNESDTTALLWAAAVVWNRRHIGNRRDADAQSSQRTHRRFTTRTWTFDLNFQVLDALLYSGTTCHFRGNLRSKRCRFARTFEPLTTRRCPSQGIALTITDGDDGVVERCMHVCNAVSNVFTDFFTYASSGRIGWCFSHNEYLPSIISSKTEQPYAALCEYVHWCVYADHAQAGHDDDGSHGSSQYPSSA